mmetsp:Transcript_13451/g.18217  ORF Transcript_13451/g.18217 Transcript_13451/m.18217 type:complete len:111 (-) Transcript_13451:123-455(-)
MDTFLPWSLDASLSMGFLDLISIAMGNSPLNKLGFALQIITPLNAGETQRFRATVFDECQIYARVFSNGELNTFLGRKTRFHRADDLHKSSLLRESLPLSSADCTAQLYL